MRADMAKETDRNELVATEGAQGGPAPAMSGKPWKAYAGHESFMPYLLNRTTSALNADFHAVLRNHGMTLLHWRVLAFLTETDGLGVSALAGVTDVDQATLSRALTVMEGAGYIAREPHGHDQRMVVIKIRPAGKQQFKHVLPLAWSIYDRAVAGLSDEEQQTLHSLLNQIRDNLRRQTSSRL